ncbi:MAG: VIT domain-containing protein [Candidatus Eremiobacteraeota bacterium]|nr:VIT domain-containing protein [Candidatus Eremiobacteraeota bacterium]
MEMKVRSLVILLAFLAALSASWAWAGNDVTEGTLKIIDKQGKTKALCPLRHTAVKADITGFMARVKVTQQFHNPSKEKIEAVYVFPLPSRAAVDDMVMHVGKRTIKGDIKKREEAKKIYEAAKKQGHVASLLEQERPNIFTQSVANIMPGEAVNIEISYVEYLSYQDGIYEFVFPMVVGPRYIPGRATGAQGTGWASDTNDVPDASRITPPVTPKGTRAGHDIEVSLSIDAGVPIRKIRSVLHRVHTVQQEGSSRAQVTLDQLDNIPNKDFILQYETAGKSIEDACLTHASKARGGFFSLIVQPPLRPEKAQITPKEMIFVIDSSGSQMGWPIEKAKETMKYCIENMNDGDTFNLMAFSNNVVKLFDAPQPNSKKNREEALDFLAHRLGGGGTEMLPAMMAALEPKPDPEKLRIVCFMTDGYVGNDMQIIDAVKKNIGKARLFSFGVGNSVNRYLLDKMAEMGRGEAEYVTLNRHGDEVAEAFQQKIGTPILTDISIDWGNLPVREIFPKYHPDLFSGKPLVFTGRYSGASKGDITLKGFIAGKPHARKIAVTLPGSEAGHEVLASLWARTCVEYLMDQDLLNIQQNRPNPKIKNEITKLGLDYRIMTQYTSFVAVEEKVVTEGGVPKTVVVPVEMPDGVSYEGVFGEEKSKADKGAMKMRAYNAPSSMAGPAGSGSGAARMNKMAMPSQGYLSGDESRYTPPAKKPEEKLASSLKDIASKVKAGGGTYVTAQVEVRGGKIPLIVTVTHLSKKVLADLKAAGLKIATYSAGQKVVTGTLPVEKLDDLAKLPAVEKIEPLTGGRKISFLPMTHFMGILAYALADDPVPPERGWCSQLF